MELFAFTNLPKEAGVASRALRDRLYPTCALHKANIREVEELHQVEYGEQI